MKELKPDVKKATKQSDFANEKKPKKKMLDLVIEHPPTKPEQVRKQN